jgi:hypothetical protein
MDAIIWYTIWLIVTSLWACKKDESAGDVIFRYCFTFILNTIMYVAISKYCKNI